MLFPQAWASFLSTGQFLKFTRLFEDPLQRTETFIFNNGTTGRLHDTGILSFIPRQKSDSYLLISSGIHGNETAPIEIVDQLCQAIIKSELDVKVNLMLIIGNPAAIDFGQRFVDQNLNRLFCGLYKKQSSSDYEVKRAAIIEQSVYDFFASAKNNEAAELYHLDMHTAIRASHYERFALCPYLDKRPLNEDFISIFGGSEIETLLLGNQPAGTFSYFTSHFFKAHSATLELGQVRPFGKNDAAKFLPVKTNCEKLIRAEKTNKKPFNYQDYGVFKVKGEVLKISPTFRLLLDDDVENFTSFKKGELLASDHRGHEYRVEKDGDAIVFPNNNVPVGQRMAVVIERVNQLSE